jgi:hypothetical protein
VVTLLIQSVAVVVQATATSIIYIDCRMRREGLDIDLLTYIERRDAGGIGLADPYRENVGRVIAPRPAPQPYPAPGYPVQPYPGPGYGTPGMGAQGYPGQGYQGYPPQAGYAPAPQAGYAPPPQAGYAPPPQAGSAAPPPYAAYAPPPPTPPAPSDARGAGHAERPEEQRIEDPRLSDSPGDEASAQPPATRWAAPGSSADAVDPESPWS